ncbi:hypothetical protein KUE79_002746 [Listeria monocytogenes]|nr:hypothetical protein [Listeria monocytogenes]
MSGELFEKEKWKEDLLLYLTDHHAELEFEDGIDDILIKGLKFYTTNDGQKTIPELMTMTMGMDYQPINDELEL